jgi:hypothetical protein
MCDADCDETPYKHAPHIPMHSQPPRTQLEDDLCIHLFSVSSAMVGVCLTVIGLLRVVISMGPRTSTVADDILALDSVLFLITSLAAYWALRTRRTRRMHRLERFADWTFVVAMVLMAVACGVITYSIAAT